VVRAPLEDVRQLVDAVSIEREVVLAVPAQGAVGQPPAPLDGIVTDADQRQSGQCADAIEQVRFGDVVGLVEDGDQWGVVETLP
jgi:hypothetical protein